MNTVSLIQNHWYIIGTRLGLPENVLKEFWKEASRLKMSPAETYCCCKMLLYWHLEGNNVTVETFLDAANFPPFCFDETVSVIKSMLLEEVADKSHLTTLSSEVNDTERQYAAMVAEVVELLDQCDANIDKYKHYLDHCKSEHSQKQTIEKNVYEHVANISDLIGALRNNGYISHMDLSWLKRLIHDIANSSKALRVIQKYEEMNVAQKLHWSNMSSTQTTSQKMFLMAKTNKSPALLSGKDVSGTKSVATKLAGIDETDALLESAGVGSVILYWKISDGVRLEVPKSITQSMSQVCSKAGITHIGTIVNQNVTLVEIVQMTHTSKHVCTYVCTMHTVDKMTVCQAI